MVAHALFLALQALFHMALIQEFFNNVFSKKHTGLNRSHIKSGSKISRESFTTTSEKLYKLLYGLYRLKQIITIKKALLQSIFEKHKLQNENEV